MKTLTVQSTKKTFAGRVLAARFCICFSLFSPVLLVLAQPAYAKQVAGRFTVTATFVPATAFGNPTRSLSAFCQNISSTAFGAVVTTVCATGEVVNISTNPQRGGQGPVHGGAYRFLLTRPGDTQLLVDSFTELGTIASWRSIRIADKDYLELLLGW